MNKVRLGNKTGVVKKDFPRQGEVMVLWDDGEITIEKVKNIEYIKK